MSVVKKKKKMIPAPTPEQIRAFCRQHYYTDGDTLWEPFEYDDEYQVAEFIEADAIALADFLKIKLPVKLS